MNPSVSNGARAIAAPAHVKNARLVAWVAEMAELTEPSAIH